MSGAPARRATSTCWSNVDVPTKLSKRARELLDDYAEETGDEVGSGGLREKLGLG